MRGSSTKSGRQCDVTVTKSHLKCTLKSSLGPDVFLEINLSDILAVQTPRDNANGNTIIVHYAGHKKDNVLSWEKIVLTRDPELCRELNTVFTHVCADRLKARHLLVIVNPYSGKKIAGRVFHKKIAPLFRACGIAFTVYVTTGPNDAGNAFKDVDFSTLDGVVLLGGDGFISEVVTALVQKQQQLAGVDTDDPDAKLKPLPFPVGVIPCGSGNFLVDYLHGTKDYVTAAIKIVQGKTTPSNLCSVHQGGKLERYGTLLTAFGLIGDMMHVCEKNRWMGNMRYKVLPIKCMLFNRRLIDAEVEVLKDGSDEWQSIKGSFHSIDSNMVVLEDTETKLVPVFGETSLPLRLTSTCPLGEHIKQLSKLADYQTGAYNYEFIHMLSVKRYRVSMATLPTVQSDDGEVTLRDSYHLNLDGESLLMNKPKFEIALHTGIIQLFGEAEFVTDPQSRTNSSSQI